MLIGNDNKKINVLENNVYKKNGMKCSRES